jgi:hypothetical protein
MKDIYSNASAQAAPRPFEDVAPLTGEPAEWHIPEPTVVTWYEEATAYTVMKWPSLAAHSHRPRPTPSGRPPKQCR